MDEKAQSVRSTVKNLRGDTEEAGRRQVSKRLGEEGTDPWATVGSLQATLSVDLPAYNNVAQFLQSMGSSRQRINAGLLDGLKEQLEAQFGCLTEESSLLVLKVCVETIHVKELRPILINLANRIASIPASYLDLFVKSGCITVSVVSGTEVVRSL
jgi:hypothetical protein